MHINVAPHAGARIETLYSLRNPRFLYVAPHAGARIETSSEVNGLAAIAASLPTRERELKPLSHNLVK